MAKRMVSARIEGDLLDAVTARTEERGENVTDVIVRGFRAYLDPSGTQVLTADEARPQPGLPRSACPHPKARVFKGLCHLCGKAVP